jgi:hypothetical protein
MNKAGIARYFLRNQFMFGLSEPEKNRYKKGTRTKQPTNIQNPAVGRAFTESFHIDKNVLVSTKWEADSWSRRRLHY